MDDTLNSYTNYTLYGFAYCGKPDQFDNALRYLASTAEKEPWGFYKDDISILKTYIFKTFERCSKEGKILCSPSVSCCCVNTGLLTDKGKDIVMFFEPNMSDSILAKDWYFRGFISIQDREFVDTFDKIPELASYTDNPEDFFFNPEYEIEVNIDHILDDNWERIKSAFDQPKEVAELILIGALDKAKKKAKRNMRLVLPQYYNEEIGFLLPIEIPKNGGKEVMVFALEKTPFKKYRASTMFDLKTAYAKARLLMKIENNWLRPEGQGS